MYQVWCVPVNVYMPSLISQEWYMNQITYINRCLIVSSKDESKDSNIKVHADQGLCENTIYDVAELTDSSNEDNSFYLAKLYRNLIIYI